METGPEFIEKTKYPHLSSSEQDRGIPQPPLERPLEQGGMVRSLPPPHCIDTPLIKFIDARASLRSYAKQSLNQEELSYLLWCCQGVKSKNKNATFRTVPSAGARHALDTYVLVNRVEGLTSGLYRFLALDHHLQEFMINDDIGKQVTQACGQQEFILRSAATFIWVAVVERMFWRYSQRGYRYLFLDAGHACQNVYLAAESIGCGACAVAAFYDDGLNELLHLDGEHQFVIYLAAIGKKK